MFFKISSFQEILKIHDGTPLESEEILTYIKKPPKQIGMALSSKLYVPNNVVHKKRVAWILFFKIRPSQEILKIRDGTHLEGEEILTYIKKLSKRMEILKIHDGTPLESEEILTYIKKPPKQIGMALSSKLYVPNNLVHKKRVAWILFFKIWPSQEILKIRDGTHSEAEEILTYIKKALETDGSFQEILKIHDGTPLDSEEILTYIKKPPKQIVMAWILCFKIRPSQEILKIRDGTPLEAEEILTHKKSSRNGSVWHFFNKLDDPSNIVQKESVARILFFKIRSFQEILKIHDGTPLEAEEILTHKKILETDRVAWILCFKIRPSQEILKIRDGTPLESEEILTYIKKPPKQIGMALSSKLDVPNNVVHKKRVAWILCFNIRSSQEILKIRDGTPLEAEEILTHKKSSRNGSVWHFFNKLDDPSNIVQKESVARILFFKIRSFQEILKIHDGTPLEAEEILTHKKILETDRPSQEILKIRDGTPLESSQEIQKNHDVAWIMFFKIRPSQEILKIRDGTHLEGEEILTYIKKSSRNGWVWHFFNKLNDPSNIVQKKRVARILFFKIRSFQEILKIHDGTPLESEEILTYIKKPPKQIEILKIRDGTPLEAEEILTHKKVLETDRPSQEILKIRDGTPLESSQEIQKNHDVHKKRVAWILFFKIRPSQEILKIRDGAHLEAEEILTYIKKALETDRF
ncbi:hypothetical protein OROMI_005118 [Orobanche minor]